MQEKLKTYKSHPLSFLFLIITILAVSITVALFIFIVGYVIIKGVPYLKPSLFSLHYTTENVSMLPAIITTLEMVGISLLISAPLGVFCAIYRVEYANR